MMNDLLWRRHLAQATVNVIPAVVAKYEESYPVYKKQILAASKDNVFRYSKFVSRIESVPITNTVDVKLDFRDIRSVVQDNPGASVICDINPIVPGGGFQLGDQSNESLLCYGSTLYPILTSRIIKMQFYYANATMGRWGHDLAILVPDVLFFMPAYSPVGNRTEGKPDIREPGKRLSNLADWYTCSVVCSAPPVMTNSSAQLKSCLRTEVSLYRRLLLSLELAVNNKKDAVVVLPLYGFETFNNRPQVVENNLIKCLSDFSCNNLKKVVIAMGNNSYKFPHLAERINEITVNEQWSENYKRYNVV